MTLLHHMKGCMGIYFPVPESCEFSTTTCREKCIAKVQQLTHGLAAETRKLLSPEIQNLIAACPIPKHYPTRAEQKEALETFENGSVAEVTLLLLEELQNSTERIIHWFASGDCQKAMTRKVIDVIRRLESFGYVSCGFTRNYDLAHGISSRYGWHRLFYTVEKGPKGPTVLYGEDATGYMDGYHAVPDYSTGEVALYYGQSELGGCGARSYSWRNIQHADGCAECLVRNCGCFTKTRIYKEQHVGLWEWLQARKTP